MTFAAGALSRVLIGSTEAELSSAAATGGTGPYTYQWYRSTTTGFTPGGGNILTGETSLSLSDSGLSPGTQYYYKVVATDTGNSNVTATSSQLAVKTNVADQNQDQFSQSTIVGMLDQRFNYDTISCQLDEDADEVFAGSAVKIVDSAGGVPKVEPCDSNADDVLGFVQFNLKDQSYSPGDRLEVSCGGNVQYLCATDAISRGAQVQLDISRIGGVAAKSGSSGAAIVGWALDKGAEGQFIRVFIQTPGFEKA